MVTETSATELNSLKPGEKTSRMLRWLSRIQGFRPPNTSPRGQIYQFEDMEHASIIPDERVDAGSIKINHPKTNIEQEYPIISEETNIVGGVCFSESPLREGIIVEFDETGLTGKIYQGTVNAYEKLLELEAEDKKNDPYVQIQVLTRAAHITIIEELFNNRPETEESKDPSLASIIMRRIGFRIMPHLPKVITLEDALHQDINCREVSLTTAAVIERFLAERMQQFEAIHPRVSFDRSEGEFPTHITGKDEPHKYGHAWTRVTWWSKHKTFPRDSSARIVDPNLLKSGPMTITDADNFLGRNKLYLRHYERVARLRGWTGK